jgi:hypothetical protein
LKREVDVLTLQRGRYGPRDSRTFRGLQIIQSEVLPYFNIAPEVLNCW